LSAVLNSQKFLRLLSPLLCILFVNPKAWSCNLSIGLSSDFPPYHAKAPGQNWQGVTVDLAQILVEQAGCSLNIVELPWARSIKLLESGEIQLISHFTYTEERAKYTQFLGPHHIETIAFIANKNLNQDVQTPDKLAQFSGKIGITRGDQFGDEFDKYVLKNELVNDKLVDIRNNNDRVAMLLVSRLDGIFYDEMSSQLMLAANPRINKKYAVRFTLQGSPVYWGVSFRYVSADVREKLNQAWLFMLENKMIEPVYKKYGLTINIEEFEHYPLKRLSLEN
jgi:polar amino acid transport system substrate-binding protein